ncbi:MAG: hypothetical protein Kow0090_18520 [Myxococcota bacterium]
MRDNLEADLTKIIAEAIDIAKSLGQEMNSCYLLLAVFTIPNGAEGFLIEQGIDEDTLLSTMERISGEGKEMTERIIEQATLIAESTGKKKASALHLLLAICRERQSLAYMMLINAGANMASLRTRLMSAATRKQPLYEETQVHSRAGERSSHTSASTSQTNPSPAAPTARQNHSIVKESQKHPSKQPPKLTEKPEPRKSAAKTISVKNNGAFYILDEEKFPQLVKLGKNLTQLAAENKIDPLVGRGREIEEIIDILGKRRANNPLLVGEPGVGKTAIVEGLVNMAYRTPKLLPALAEKVIVELDLNRIFAGTSLRGALAERLNGIREEVKRAEGRVIVFIDEIHSLSGLSAGDSPEEAANSLKASLARGEFPCIGATTSDELRKFLNSDPAFERRFEIVLIPEPSVDDTVKILDGIKEEYEKHHGVKYTADALQAAAILSSRYLSERFLPDKAISLIDLAGSRARRVGKDFITEEEIARVVSKIASIPEDKLTLKDSERLLKMEEELSKRIIGHDKVIESVAKVIRRNYVGFRAKRPIGSFIFLGPTGVGKTELVKALADFLFNSRDALVRVDMSEYSESHSTSRLIGAPPGYVGYEAGGQLTEQIRRKPFQIVLLDEVEKAHRDVLQILLQVLDEGRLTDGRGRTVDFTNTIVVMTSNLGSDKFGKKLKPKIGFAGEQKSEDDEMMEDYEKRAADVLTSAKRFFPPELWNRIEERLVFAPLGREQLKAIARLELEKSSHSLEVEKKIEFSADESAVEWILENGGYQPELGARPLRQTIQRFVEAAIAENILRGEFIAGDKISVSAKDNRLYFSKEPNAH